MQLEFWKNHIASYEVIESVETRDYFNMAELKILIYISNHYGTGGLSNNCFASYLTRRN